MELEHLPEQSTGHVLEFTTPNRDWRFCVKWDGCVHINRFYNGATMDEPGTFASDMDYLHVCDLDDFAKAVTKLAEDTKGFRE